MNTKNTNQPDGTGPQQTDLDLQGTQEGEMVSTPPELKWYQHSFLFVLMSFLLLPRSPVIWLILFMVGMVNTDKDKWFKNRFLVFLVSVVALFGVLQWLYNKANS